MNDGNAPTREKSSTEVLERAKHINSRLGELSMSIASKVANLNGHLEDPSRKEGSEVEPPAEHWFQEINSVLDAIAVKLDRLNLISDQLDRII